ncbi:MAG: hypothetical protein COA70_13665 [Planctomycetota bacterium]|nr:MAG: hypothetical protein COA70_13665 [Planctomycetota bacterium]
MLSSTSYEEKSVWIQLLTILAVLGAYFAQALSMLLDGNLDLAAYTWSFLGSLVVLVIVQVAGHVFTALMAKPEQADERDSLIAWKSESRSSWIMGVGILSAISAMLLEVETVWVAHLLLLSLCLSEVCKDVLQIVAYRRGV